MSFYRKLTFEEIEENKQKLRQIEQLYNFQFPPLFLKFHATYKTGQHAEVWESYLDKYLRPTPIFTIQVEDESISYGWLSSPKGIERDLKYVPGINDLLVEHELLRVGDIVLPGGLFIGVGKHNQDQIYKFVSELNDTPIKLCNSIFEFLEMLLITFKYDEPSFQKPINSKYWIKKDINFEVKAEMLDSIKNYNTETQSFSTLENFLTELQKITNNAQNKHS